jgi:hypothetical protein
MKKSLIVISVVSLILLTAFYVFQWRGRITRHESMEFVNNNFDSIYNSPNGMYSSQIFTRRSMMFLVNRTRIVINSFTNDDSTYATKSVLILQNLLSELKKEEESYRRANDCDIASLDLKYAPSLWLSRYPLDSISPDPLVIHSMLETIEDSIFSMNECNAKNDYLPVK